MKAQEAISKEELGSFKDYLESKGAELVKTN